MDGVAMGETKSGRGGECKTLHDFRGSFLARLYFSPVMIRDVIRSKHSYGVRSSSR